MADLTIVFPLPPCSRPPHPSPPPPYFPPVFFLKIRKTLGIWMKRVVECRKQNLMGRSHQSWEDRGTEGHVEAQAPEILEGTTFMTG